MMRALSLCLCSALLLAADRFALVIGTSGEARSAALGLAAAGFDVERSWQRDQLTTACERWLVRLHRGQALAVLYFAGPAIASGTSVRLGGLDGPDAGQLLAGIATAPHASAVVMLDASEGDWGALAAPVGSAVLLRPRAGRAPGRPLADHLVECLLAPGVAAGQAMTSIRRRDPATAIDSKLPLQLVLSADEPNAAEVSTDAAYAEFQRIYITTMRRQYDQAAQQHLGDLPLGLKARAWVGFLTTFRYDAPDWEDDETLRSQAVQALVGLGRDNPTAGILAPPRLPLTGLDDDPLPDMRWMVERAVRVQAAGEAGRQAAIRAWSLVLRLYPDDDPTTHNDDIWRVLATAALRELGSPHLDLRPPRPPARDLLPPPEDPLRDLLGIASIARGQGLELVEVDPLANGLGLRAGDRLLAAEGQALTQPRDLAQALHLAQASGSLALHLADGRRLHLRLQPEPALARLTGQGQIADGGPAERLALPPIAGPWILACDAAPGLVLTVDDRPISNRTALEALGARAIINRTPTDRGILAICESPSLLHLARTTPSGGAWAWSATPMSLATRRAPLHAGNGWSDTVKLAAAVGETLWIEASATAEITLTGATPNGVPLWAEPLPRDPDGAFRQVIVIAGRADHTVPQAIATAGMVEITVRARDAIDASAIWKVGRSQPWTWR